MGGRDGLFSLRKRYLLYRAAIGRRRSMWHRLASSVQRISRLPGMPFLRPRLQFQDYPSELYSEKVLQKL